MYRTKQPSARRNGWRETATPCKPLAAEHPSINETDWQQIHLHGRDFAILHYSEENTPFNPREFVLSCADNKNLICDNSPRRDVVLVPPGGFTTIVFKTVNPESLLMHCYIAFHASNGLALQILERLPDAQQVYATSKPSMQKVRQVCEQWVPW